MGKVHRYLPTIPTAPQLVKPLTPSVHSLNRLNAHRKEAHATAGRHLALSDAKSGRTHASLDRPPYIPPIKRRGVYLASPLPTYGTARYDRVANLIRAKYSSEPLVEPRDLYASNEDWRNPWPGTVATIARLVFFANPDKSIGAGVLRELADAQWQGVPIEFASDAGRLADTYALDFLSDNDPCRVAIVRVGSIQ